MRYGWDDWEWFRLETWLTMHLFLFINSFLTYYCIYWNFTTAERGIHNMSDIVYVCLHISCFVTLLPCTRFEHATVYVCIWIGIY